MLSSQVDNGIDTITPENNRTERVALETSTHLIKGTITLPRQGYRSRFSDYMNRHDVKFVPLTDVEHEPLDGATPSRHPFVLVARESVRAAFPLDGEG